MSWAFGDSPASYQLTSLADLQELWDALNERVTTCWVGAPTNVCLTAYGDRVAGEVMNNNHSAGAGFNDLHDAIESVIGFFINPYKITGGTIQSSPYTDYIGQTDRPAALTLADALAILGNSGGNWERKVPLRFDPADSTGYANGSLGLDPAHPWTVGDRARRMTDGFVCTWDGSTWTPVANPRGSATDFFIDHGHIDIGDEIGSHLVAEIAGVINLMRWQSDIWTRRVVESVVQGATGDYEGSAYALISDAEADVEAGYTTTSPSGDTGWASFNFLGGEGPTYAETATAYFGERRGNEHPCEQIVHCIPFTCSVDAYAMGTYPNSEAVDIHVEFDDQGTGILLDQYGLVASAGGSSSPIDLGTIGTANPPHWPTAVPLAGRSVYAGYDLATPPDSSLPIFAVIKWDVSGGFTRVYAMP